MTADALAVSSELRARAFSLTTREDRAMSDRPPAAPSVGPVTTSERIAALDVVRGVAILGILLVNLTIFAGADWLRPGGYEGADAVLRAMIGVLAETKFITIFALLFGLGLAYQLARADARDGPGRWLLTRRLAVLAVIGGAHAVLVWSGDILLPYAVLGLLLLPFLRRSARACVLWAVALIALTATLMLASGTMLTLAESAGEAGAVAMVEESTAQMEALADRSEAAYASGSYAAMVAQRLHELPIYLADLVFILPVLLGMALLGVAVVRSGMLADLSGHRGLLRRATRWGLALGLPVNLVGGVLLAGDATASTPQSILGWGLITAGAPLLALAYAAIAARLALARPGARLAGWLGAVGRTALSNYLLQSVLATTLFYGLGLYGQVSLTTAFLAVPLIWTVNLVASAWWTARFRLGPVEWAWRWGTYGRRPALRRDPGAAAGSPAA